MDTKKSVFTFDSLRNGNTSRNFRVSVVLTEVIWTFMTSLKTLPTYPTHTNTLKYNVFTYISPYITVNIHTYIYDKNIRVVYIIYYSLELTDSINNESNSQSWLVRLTHVNKPGLESSNRQKNGRATLINPPKAVGRLKYNHASYPSRDLLRCFNCFSFV